MYYGGASKTKSNYTSTNRNTVLLRAILNVLKSIDKSDKKNEFILAYVRTITTLLEKKYSAVKNINKSNNTSSSNKSKKSGKGSNMDSKYSFYAGKAAQLMEDNSSMQSLQGQLLSMQQGSNEDEYEEMNYLIEELVKLTQD